MTEFRVGCFHINFFPRQMKETYFKGVKNNVQVVNNHITQSKMIVSFFSYVDFAILDHKTPIPAGSLCIHVYRPVMYFDAHLI